MLQFGLRLGGNPRCLVATTPRPTKLIRELLAREGRDVAVTRGSTYENRANLAPGFFDQVIRKYEGTRLGRQEPNAELLEDTPGACGAMVSSKPRARRQRQIWRELLLRLIRRRARVRRPMKPASSSSAKTTRVTVMCWPMPRENTSRSNGRKSRLPHTGRIGPTASWPSATTVARWSRRQSA